MCFLTYKHNLSEKRNKSGMTVLLNCQETSFCSAQLVCYTNWLSHCFLTACNTHKISALWLTYETFEGLTTPLSQLASLTTHPIGTWSSIIEIWLYLVSSCHVNLRPVPFICIVNAFLPIFDSVRVQEHHLHLKLFLSL